MTKDVLVSISGLQMAVNDVESNDDEPIEILIAGTYFFKDGTHYIFFEEVETEDPAEYVRQMLKGNLVTVSAERESSGVVTVYADCDGLIQKFIFTPV